MQAYACILQNWQGLKPIATHDCVRDMWHCRCACCPRRYLLRELVVQYLSRQFPKWTAIDKALESEGWKLVTLLRLSPIAPWNVLNYALSVTAVPLAAYVAASSLAVRGWPLCSCLSACLSPGWQNSGEAGAARFSVIDAAESWKACQALRCLHGTLQKHAWVVHITLSLHTTGQLFVPRAVTTLITRASHMLAAPSSSVLHACLPPRPQHKRNATQ